MSKRIINYSVLLLYFFVSLVFIYTLSRGDTFVNYGFSYAISNGEIPYKDFNMVITPLAPFLYTVFIIFSKNILFYYFGQAILLTILFHYLYKLLEKKSLLLLLILMIPYPISMVSIIFPGYNFLIILLFVLFIYCLKNKNNYYLLGVILGLIFTTKQTIGLVLFLPSFYYLFKDYKKFIKLCIGYLIPCLLLLIYLLITNSIKEFINLCFLGLFEFGNNHSIDIYYLILFIIGIIYIIYKIIKNKNNLLYYYGLAFSVVVLPIIDYYHVCLFLFIVFYYFVDSISLKDRAYKYIIIFIMFMSLLWTYITYFEFNQLRIRNYNNFNYVVFSSNYFKRTDKLINYVNSTNYDVIYFMRGSENYFHKIINNKKIDYFDLPNEGNYGYNGTHMMKEKIDNLHEVIFVIDKVLLYNKDINQQYLKELGKYVVLTSKKIKSIGIYDIYYKE